MHEIIVRYRKNLGLTQEALPSVWESPIRR